jgi:hypothetical protein
MKQSKIFIKYSKMNLPTCIVTDGVIGGPILGTIVGGLATCRGILTTLGIEEAFAGT